MLVVCVRVVGVSGGGVRVGVCWWCVVVDDDVDVVVEVVVSGGGGCGVGAAFWHC